MAYREQIIELKNQGKSIRKIAESLDLARNTIRRYLRESEALKPQPSTRPKWTLSLDWDELVKKHQSGIQINQLYEEYAPKDVALPTFYRRFTLMKAKAPATKIPQIHNPAEKVQVDYTDGILVYDPETGLAKKTQLFCGVLPFSGYCFGEFTWNQKQTSFLKSHENMWRFFGGVTPYVVLDNLKSGVHKAHRYDPEVNPTYCDFANHYGFAALPARPYKPRDKAIVEANIGAIQRTFYQQVNDKKFWSISELNKAFRQFLTKFNNRLMKDHGVSRWERFQSEKDKLLPLPIQQYDVREWTTAIVHPDCHIQIKHCFYSVPFQLVSQEVRVRISGALIEVFDGDCNSVAAHQRVDGRGRRVTIDAHLPQEKLQACRFEIGQAKEKAGSIGPCFKSLMDKLFEGHRPLANLRRAQGMIRIYGKDGIDSKAMEYAAGQCLTFHKFRLDYFKSCASAFVRNHHKNQRTAPKRDLNTICLRA